jgi:hypothetical protein
MRVASAGAKNLSSLSPRKGRVATWVATTRTRAAGDLDDEMRQFALPVHLAQRTHETIAVRRVEREGDILRSHAKQPFGARPFVGAVLLD